MAIRVMQAILSVARMHEKSEEDGETNAAGRAPWGGLRSPFAAHLGRRPDGGGAGDGAVGAVRLVGRVQLRQHSHPPLLDALLH